MHTPTMVLDFPCSICELKTNKTVVCKTAYGSRMHMRNVHGLKRRGDDWAKTTRDQDRNKRR